MELRLLEIFCVVYEEMSFSKAAERLGLSQPTISGHIKSLEAFFATSLFDRLGREIRPTPAGRLLFERGRTVSDLKRSILESMDGFLNRLEGQVLVGVSTIPGEHLLPEMIGRLHRRHPRLRVRVEISDSYAVIAGVEKGRYEVGLVGARTDHNLLRFRRFASDRLVLLAPTDGAWRGVETLDLNGLARRPLLIREPGSGTRLMFERRLQQLGRSLEDFNVIAELGSTAAVIRAVKATGGCSIVSDLAIETELGSGSLRTITVTGLGPLERDFYVVRDARVSQSPICRLFIEQFEGADAAP